MNTQKPPAIWPTSLFFLSLSFASLFTALIVCESRTYANSADKKSRGNQQTTSASKSYATETSPAFFENIETAFDSPFLRNSVKAGTKAINQSIENIMDALFYSLMDNDWTLARNGDLRLKLKSERKIYSAETSEFVVIDRLSIGPEYARELGNFKNIPISLNTGVGADYYEIYKSSNAERLTDSASDDIFTWSFKNWFGALPILGAILPPSFNPNELYDPTRLLSPPFKLPVDKKSFETMPLGSIRSYAIKGGINLPLATGVVFGQQLKNKLQSMGGLDFTMPYSIFVNGEYRISVLRKSKNLAWVGLSKTKSIGHGLFSLIGRTIFVLEDISSDFSFSGIPLPYFPLDSDISSAIVDSSTLLYEFDLNRKDSLAAYIDAVAGNFAPAHEAAKNQNSGVNYFFTQESLSQNDVSKNSLELGLFSNTDHRKASKAENKITNNENVFYSLEVKESLKKSSWDILVGETSNQINMNLTLHVEKQKLDPETKFSYRDIENPWQLTFTAKLNDAFTSGVEIKTYKNILEQTSALDLADFPKFDAVDKGDETLIRSKRLTSIPYRRQHNFAAQPQLLGHFSANISVKISTDQLKDIYKNARTTFKEKYREALFERLTPTKAHEDLPKNLVAAKGARFLNLAVSPLRAVGVDRLLPLKIAELEYRAALLETIGHANTPQEHQALFNDFFQTDYPYELFSAFIQTAAHFKAFRTVKIYAKPAKGLAPGESLKFERLNRMKFAEGKDFSEWESFNNATKNVNSFEPQALLTSNSKIEIKKIVVRRSDSSTKIRKDQFPFIIDADIADLSKNAQTLDIYLRIENAGKLDLGRLILAEAVLKKPVSMADSLTSIPIEISPKDAAPLNTFLLGQAVKLGTNLRISIALSDRIGRWSSIKTIDFSYKNGEITLIK